MFVAKVLVVRQASTTYTTATVPASAAPANNIWCSPVQLLMKDH